MVNYKPPTTNNKIFINSLTNTLSKTSETLAYVISLQQCLLTVYALCSESLFLTSHDL